MHVFTSYIKKGKVIQTNYAQQKACNILFKNKYIMCCCDVFCNQPLIVTILWKQCKSANTYWPKKHSTKKEKRLKKKDVISEMKKKRKNPNSIDNNI